MSEMSRNARRAMRAKAHRLANAATGKVDASDYGPEEVLDTEAPTGMRPVSRRQFKSGGVVTGAAPAPNAGRMPRKSGGRALTANSYINRDQKEANEEREGKKHVGGYKRGGRTYADGGNAGDAVPTERFGFQPAQSRVVKAAGLKHGGRSKKAGGGMLNPDDVRLVEPPDQVPDSAPRGAAVGALGALTGAMARQRLADAARAAAMQRAMAGPGQGGNLGSIADIVARGNRDPYERMPRKSGGGAWIKDAIKHPGALRKELHAKAGEPIPAKTLEKAEHSKNPKLAKRARLAETLRSMHADGGSVSDGTLEGTRPTGGRLARKHGGKAKTNVNIVIATGAGRGQQQPGGPMPAGQITAGAMPVPVGAMGGPPGAPPGMPPGAPPPMPMPPAGGPPPGGPPMMRKEGGRVGHRSYRSPKDMDAGAGSGFGRLEKEEIEKRRK